MANQYKNKIIYGNQTLMDITDTTATENDVLDGEVFYTANGARSVGTLTDATQSAHGLMSAADKIKLDGIDLLGVKLNTTALTPDANGYVSIPLMVGATSSTAGTAGLVPAPTTGDVDKFLAGDGTYKSGGLPMVILSYGNSTWAEFEAAYKNNVIVYARASSNSNPATGSQTRMAFMAYVNNATTPTEVEFQYYRSMSAHSATAMGDQVFVYKLTKTGGWSVTTRDASIKEINVATGSKLGVSWSSNKVTLSNTMTANDMPMSSSDATTVDSAITSLSGQIGTLSSLTTTNKSDLVSAVNEVNGNLSTKADYDNRHPVLTLNSSYSNLSIPSDLSRIRSGIFVFSVSIKVDSGSITTGEKAIGTVSPVSTAYTTGAIVRNNDTKLLGSFLLASNGTLYINPTEAINNGITFRLQGTSPMID